MQAYRFPVMWNDWTIGSFRAAADVTRGSLGDAMKRFAADPRDEAAANVLYENPSYVGLTRTTCIATRLTAGHADNALPQSATATVNCRIFPGVGFEPVRAALASVVGEGVEVRLTDEGVPSDASPMRKDVMAAVATAVHASYPGTPIVPQMAAYATDGSVFRGRGDARPMASVASSSRTARASRTGWTSAYRCARSTAGSRTGTCS